jgi:hypothetical protein
MSLATIGSERPAGTSTPNALPEAGPRDVAFNGPFDVSIGEAASSNNTDLGREVARELHVL